MHERLLAELQGGRTAALARAISIVENHRAGFEELLSALHPRSGRARRIGITGPPGAGKSTLTMCLAQRYRSSGLSVGIVCVDPTSPFSGGALLGDRIRMEDIALDSGVYIRSLATRGALGGISAATREVCDVLDAFGFDRILIETVGVGQSELDVARTADSSLLVLVPESGDSIQTLKAGLMEAADLFAVNKADRPGADRLRREIAGMLGMRSGAISAGAGHQGVELGGTRPNGPSTSDRDEWTPPVLATVASEGVGIDDVVAALDQHFQYLERTGTLRQRRRAGIRERVVDAVGVMVRTRLWSDADTEAFIVDHVPDIESGRMTPFQVAGTLLARSGRLLTGGRDDVDT